MLPANYTEFSVKIRTIITVTLCVAGNNRTMWHIDISVCTLHG
jgi:hypothetical protein